MKFRRFEAGRRLLFQWPDLDVAEKNFGALGLEKDLPAGQTSPGTLVDKFVIRGSVDENRVFSSPLGGGLFR